MINKADRQQRSLWRTAKGSISASKRPVGDAICDRERQAREAWALAGCERDALQMRIVHAFRQYAEGRGPGPCDSDLMLFAQSVIAERRLARELARVRVTLGARPR